jgi:hypothetical protein
LILARVLDLDSACFLAYATFLAVEGLILPATGFASFLSVETLETSFFPAFPPFFSFLFFSLGDP